MLNYIYYSSVYFLLVFLIYIFHAFNRQNNKRFLTLSFFLLFIFAAISYDVGWDYIPYYRALTFDMSFDRFEQVEYYLAVFCIKIDFPQLFFIVNHLIIVLFLMMAIGKESKNQYLSVIAFLCFPLFYLGGLSEIRFAAALSIVLFGYVFFLKERKIVLFLITLIFASLFHTAILVAILLIPIRYFRVSRMLNIIALVLSVFFSNLFFSRIVGYEGLTILGDDYNRLMWYLDSENTIGGQSKLHYFFLVLNIINLISYDKLKSIDENNVQFITIFSMGCCLAFLFSENMVLMSRLSRVFYFFIIFLLPYYSQLFTKFKKQSTNTFIVLFSVLLLAYQLSLHNYDGEEIGRISTYWPYKVFFLH